MSAIKRSKEVPYLTKNVFIPFLIFVFPWHAYAADDRLATKITVLSSAPFLQSVADSMLEELTNSRVIRLISWPETSVEFEVIVDGSAASGTDGLMGAVAVIFSIRCPDKPTIYVGHRVGVCGGLYSYECGSSLARSTEQQAQTALNYLRSPDSCRAVNWYRQNPQGFHV